MRCGEGEPRERAVQRRHRVKSHQSKRNTHTYKRTHAHTNAHTHAHTLTSSDAGVVEDAQSTLIVARQNKAQAAACVHCVDVSALGSWIGRRWMGFGHAGIFYIYIYVYIDG